MSADGERMYDEETPYEVIKPTASEEQRRGYWALAAALQQCDGLQVSGFASQLGEEYVSGSIASNELASELNRLYATRQGFWDRQAEADIVAARIVSLLEGVSFTLSPKTLLGIHAALFRGVLPQAWAGRFRSENIRKDEAILGGRSVAYSDYRWIRDTLEYDFQNEARYKYRAEMMYCDVRHFSNFISNIWQVHPFREGNTRTVAVFSELYLRSLGFNVSNELFASNALYFRDSLVRASYSSLRDGIEEDHSFANDFFDMVINGNRIDFEAVDMNVHSIRETDKPYRSPNEYRSQSEGASNLHRPKH